MLADGLHKQDNAADQFKRANSRVGERLGGPRGGTTRFEVFTKKGCGLR